MPEQCLKLALPEQRVVDVHQPGTEWYPGWRGSGKSFIHRNLAAAREGNASLRYVPRCDQHTL
jgi:hypothetical protein